MGMCSVECVIALNCIFEIGTPENIVVGRDRYAGPNSFVFGSSIRNTVSLLCLQVVIY